MKKKLAFTLAEVLITLGIIGVVAALTIPNLMQKTNDKELVSGTLKINSVLANALKEMEAQDLIGVDKLSDLSSFQTKFQEHLRTVVCEDEKVCLSDGSYFTYSNQNFGGACDDETPCVEINADINGEKKPNAGGKDIYTFLVTKNGIRPKGNQESCSGLDCTAYVLANHKLWNGQISNDNLSTDTTTSDETSLTDVCASYEHGYCLDKNGNIARVTNGDLCSKEGSTAWDQMACPCSCNGGTYTCKPCLALPF